MTAALSPLSQQRLGDLLARITQVRLLVVGDLMLDRYLLGETDRISPEAPVPVVNVAEEWCVPGGAANVGANVIAMGATCRLIGAVGDDAAGGSLLEAIDSFGIPTDGVVTVAGRPTTTKTRLLARGQQVVRIDREVTTPLPAAFRDGILTLATTAIAHSEALILEDYDKGLFDRDLIRQLIQVARDRGVPVIVDPKMRNFFSYAGATLFKPNRRELEQALAHTDSTEGPDLEAARLRLGVDHLLVTLGAEGMMLASPGEAPRRAPSTARDVFDVSGAGDTVTAWAAGALAAGATPTEAAWLASLAASVEVGKRGTATVSPAEVLDAWEGTSG